MTLSKPVGATSPAPSQWQPDAILNWGGAEGSSFSGNEPLPEAHFIESRVPVRSPSGAAVLRRGAAGASGALPAKDAPPSLDSDDESTPLAERPEAEGEPGGSPAHDQLPVQSMLDEHRLSQEYDRGFAAGIEAGRVEARESVEVEKRGVREFLVALNESLANPRDFFVPMESLAIHIAEQLVRGELSLSGEAIRRLVENVLQEVEHPRERVTVRLNPADLERFSLLDGELSDVVILARDGALSRGSIKLEMSGGAIEDFVENRLEAIARSVLGENADSHLSRNVGPVQAIQRDDMTRLQAQPSKEKYSERVSPKTVHTLQAEAFAVDEDES